MKKIYTLLLTALVLLTSWTVKADKVAEGEWTLPGTYTFTLNDNYEDKVADITVKITQSNGTYYRLTDVVGEHFLTDITFSFDSNTNKLTFEKGSNSAYDENQPLAFSPYKYSWPDGELIETSSTTTFDPTTGAISFQIDRWDTLGFCWTASSTGYNEQEDTQYIIAAAQQIEEVVEQGDKVIEGTYIFNIEETYDSDAKYEIKVKIEGEDGNYTITEEGSSKFPTAVPFTYNASNNTLTFTTTPNLGAEGNTTFYPYFNEGYGVDPQSPYSGVTFNSVTGEIDFQSEADKKWGSFGFAWAVNPGIFPNYEPAYKIVSAVQVEDEVGGGDDQTPAWVDLGNATFMDGWVLPMLGIDQTLPENQYEVLLQQNSENGNLYRLVNPYATGPAAEYNIHSTKKGYIEFDVTDPEHVLFNRVAAGFAYDHPTDGPKKFSEIYCVNHLRAQMDKLSYTDPTQITGNTFNNSQTLATTFVDDVVTLNMDTEDKLGYGYAMPDARYTHDPEGKNYLMWYDADNRPINVSAKIWFPGAVKEEPAEGDITGNMTTDGDLNMGTMETPDLYDIDPIEVTASWDEEESTLTIYGINPEDYPFNPIVFTVDVAKGTATASNEQVAYTEEDNTYIFADIATKGDVKVTLRNDGENVVVEFEPWGAGMDFGDDWGGWYFMPALYNTVITLDNFNIEGLGSDADTDEPGEEITGNMTAQVDQNCGMDEPELNPADEWAVTATYDEATQRLTINNFAELNPITFTINLETGEAVSDEDILAEVQDEWELIYAGIVDIADFEGTIKATAFVDGDKTILYVEPWGEKYVLFDFMHVAYYNTVVTLDFVIPGLETSAPTITIDEITYESALESSDYGTVATVDFTVNVSSEGLDDAAVITLYYKAPNSDEFVAVEPNEDGSYTFQVILAASDEDYEITFYAASGNSKSEETVFTFNTNTQTGITDALVEGNARVRYYNLQGIELANPAAGTTVIKVVGDKATKVIIR